jgi:hypothetical protein
MNNMMCRLGTGRVGEAGQGGEATRAGIMTASTGNVPGRIFMSYRREDTAYPAGWLYDRLSGHFGRSQVFKDIDSIELGDDFVEVISAAVGSCDVLLALIGDRWLTVTGQDGRRRLDNPGDFVRLEIEAALTRNVRVIPILVEGARMPREDELPASLAKLARRNALELSPSRFDADTGRLLKVLGRTVSEAQERARQEAEEEAARRRQQVQQLQQQIRERAGAQDWDAVVAASGELAALDPAAADPGGLASAAREQIIRRQAEEKARQDAEEKARVRNESDSQAPLRGARSAFEKKIKIFISYRHEDIPFAAMALYRELKERFGRENIFFDEGRLLPGMSFLEEIRSHSTGSPGVFIAMIGPEWMPIMTARGRRGDDDYVAKEIGLALRDRWTVIPVLVDDAVLPDPLQLPPAVRALSNCQAARLRQTSLDEDVDELRARLDEIRVGMNDKVGAPVADVPVGRVIGPPDGTDSVRVSAPDILPADGEHYQTLVEEADNLVIFLGTGVNADEREGPFRAGASMLPDDADIAGYLAVMAKLNSGARELAEVAQYASMVRGEPRVFKWVKQLVSVDSEPGPVHKFLARFPKRLEELGLQKHYPMIVTSKLDLALERAFREEGEPFDVALYMAPGTEYAGKFVHLPWDSDPQPIIAPERYTGFPIVTDYGELTRTVIVRTNGAVDDLKLGYPWKSNFVITEDHYIDYLGGRPAEEVVPVQILAKLRQASCLFLGYKIAAWRHRVFLRWIFQSERLSGATHWAVERDPDMLERRFCERTGIALYGSASTDYVRGFDTFLNDHREELS